MLLTLFKRQCCFPLFKHFLETKMTWSQPIIVRECIFNLSCVCYVFVCVCLYVLCGHLLGKG